MFITGWMIFQKISGLDVGFGKGVCNEACKCIKDSFDKDESIKTLLMYVLTSTFYVYLIITQGLLLKEVSQFFLFSFFTIRELDEEIFRIISCFKGYLSKHFFVKNLTVMLSNHLLECTLRILS